MFKHKAANQQHFEECIIVLWFKDIAGSFWSFFQSLTEELNHIGTAGPGLQMPTSSVPLTKCVLGGGTVGKKRKKIAQTEGTRKKIAEAIFQNLRQNSIKHH